MEERKRVLIAENEAQLCFLIREALVAFDGNLDVDVAYNGRQALEKVVGKAVDVLITNLRMPIMGGIELTERTLDASPGTRVIWITAHGCDQVHRDARRLGIRSCLDKPIELRLLRQAVRTALEADYG